MMVLDPRDHSDDPTNIKRTLNKAALADNIYYNVLAGNEPDSRHISDRQLMPNTSSGVLVQITDPVKLTLSTCRHFILNSSRRITAAEIHSVVSKVFRKEDYKVKRIVKPLSRYLRLSVHKDVPSLIVNYGLGALKEELAIVPREQSLKRRPDLEASQHSDSRVSSIMTLNINGVKGKYAELQMLLERDRPDVVCLQETLRKASEKSLHLNGYIVNEVTADDTGQGLLMGFRKDSGFQFHTIESSPDVMIASVKGLDSSLLIGNIYRSPSRKSEVTGKVAEILKRYSSDHQCLLVGDWNEIPKRITNSLKRAGADATATGAPCKGTRVRKNRRRTGRPIDFAISSSDNLILSQAVRRNWSISDHLPVVVKINVAHRNCGPETITVFDRKKLCDPEIATAIKEHQFRVGESNPTELVKRFHEDLHQVLTDLRVIRKEKKMEQTVSLPKPIKRAIRSKRQVDKLVRRGLAPLSQLDQARKEIAILVKQQQRRFYLKSINKGIKYLKENDPRSAWRWIKGHISLGKNKLNANTVFKPGTRIPEEDPVARLGIWTEHFKKLCVAPPPWSAPTGELSSNEVIKDITDSPISWTEIVTVLKSMKKGKAAGNDMIPGEVYKLVENEAEPNSQLAKSMLMLLNGIYSGNGFPLEWRDCTVVPIFKKGEPCDPNNYRGIALINTLLKVLTKVLAARLQTVCCDLKLIRREQVGFIRSEECTAQAACLLESCQRRKIREKDTLICFLDLRKAYDMVPHDRLLFKLKKFGLGHKMISFISRMYENTFMRVRVNNRLTEPFRYERGVRQGCPTSPLLFNIYINDILDDIPPVEVGGLEQGLRGLMFADDTVILADSHTDLQSKIESVKQWMDSSAMEINPNKCGIMAIRANSNSPQIEPISYNGENIPIVDRYVYLGIEFNNTLDITEMSKFRVNRGKESLRRLGKTLANPRVPLEFRGMLIKSILIPTLHYGSEIFGMNELRINSLKRVLDNAFKMIVKKSNFCRLRVYDEFDVKSLYVSAAVSRARGLKKWAESNGLISDLIRSQCTFKSVKSTWIKEAKRWLKLMKIDLELPLKELTVQVCANRTGKMHERDRSVIGQWASSLSLGSGKAIRAAELDAAKHYLGVNTLTKIRTGTLSFTSQLVRILNLPPDLRNSCVCCKGTSREDAIHFLLDCPTFKDLREKYLPSAEFVPENAQERGTLMEKLLGGERQASCRRKTPVEVLECIEYLSQASARRAGVIARLKGSNT